jgi:hypothetical protein
MVDGKCSIHTDKSRNTKDFFRYIAQIDTGKLPFAVASTKTLSVLLFSRQGTYRDEYLPCACVLVNVKGLFS